MSLLSGEQQQIQRVARSFAEKCIMPVASEYDKKGEFHPFILEEAKKFGYFAMAVPKEYGGLEYDAVSQGLVLEEWGYACAGFGTTLAASILSMDSVFVAGTPKQKKLFFSPMVQGEMGAFALTEPGAGSDAGAGMAKAKKLGSEYVLNGTKCFISNGGYAKVYVVFASTDTSKGVKGLSAFIVEREREGFEVGATEHKLGIRSSNTVELLLKNLKIPADHLLGKEGDGMKIAMKTLDMARPAIAALALGIAQRALDESLKYFRQKYAGAKSQPSQAAQFKLADMEIQTQAARQYLYHTLALRDAGLPYTKESAIVKTLCGDTAMRVAMEAQRLLGAYGYSKECVIEKLVRDAKIMQIYEGTNQIQRLVIGRAILAEPEPAREMAQKAGR